MNTTIRSLAKPLLLALLMTLAACSGGGGSGTTPNTNVDEVLADLGVNTSESVRVDAEGNDLPEQYAPLRSTMALNKFSEIMLFGVPIEDPAITTYLNEMALTNLVPGTNNSYSWELLHDEPLANTPWTDPAARRSAAAGDFDGDGIEEVAIVYQLGGDAGKLLDG